MKNLFDLELARGLEIRATASSLGDNVACFVREQAHRFRAPCVDTEDVHHELMRRL
jgi:hypothetical protein